MSTAPSKKYYLALIFDPWMRDGVHCTHCYFGTLNREEIQTVVDEVQYFFDHFTQFTMEQVVFSIPAMFGPDNDIRVLLANDPKKFEPLQGLRNRFTALGLLRTTAHPFRPHVTTPARGRINQPFTHYALCCSGEVLYRWEIATAQLKAVV